MLPAKIIIASSGSLSVAIIALLMLAVQAFLFLRKPRFALNGWGAAVSFSAMLYAIGIFLEYNSPPGALNQFSGRLEFMAVICLIQSLHGFIFCYLGIKSKRYHQIAAAWHGFILILLWLTDSVVAETFVTRAFSGFATPYIEPALGPLGPLFVLYASLASIGGMVVVLRHKGSPKKHRLIFLGGIGFWIVLGIHDGLASMGLPARQYLMEYGFLGFAMAVLYVVFHSYMEAVAEEKYRLITEFANDSILVVQDGKIVFANPACRELIGYPGHVPESTDFLDIIVPADRKGIRKYFSSPPQEGRVPKPQMARIQRTGAKERFAEIGISFIQHRSRPAVLAIMRDLTERRREEAERLENEKKLVRLKKMESLGLLAGGVAHDLNNVLSGIVGYPDLILAGLPKNSKLRKPISRMQASGQRAVAIVKDLLTVARGVTITKVPLNLNEVIRAYLESPEHKKLLQFHPGVTVETDLDADLFNIGGSRIHVLKILMNLVSNASEAIEGSGRVTLSTENRYVDKPIKNYDDVGKGEYVLFSVFDDGPGIPANDFERIFEPFYTKKVMGRSGTGLGLTLVWNAIHDHDGYINVESDQSGTTFKLYFPITRDALPKPKPSLPIESLSGNGESILIVDDVESEREITSEMLQKLNYKTKAVSSGEEAIAYLKDHTVDLVLLDMIMDPGIDGRQTYKKIIAIHPNQKAIIVSGFAETDALKQTRRLGAGQYLKKPVRLEELGIALKKELA